MVSKASKRLEIIHANIEAQAKEAESEPEIVIDLIDGMSSADIAVPDSVPVEGWTLTLPSNHECFWWYKPNYNEELGPIRMQASYDLSPEAKEWADENMRQPYWVLGQAFDQSNSGKQFTATFMMEVFFTLEHDYILFKLRWH
jgi:hypothetical protein